jgi:hypothetical protein
MFDCNAHLVASLSSVDRAGDGVRRWADTSQVGSPTYASFAKLLQESNMTRLHDSLTVIDGLVISK